MDLYYLRQQADINSHTDQGRDSQIDGFLARIQPLIFKPCWTDAAQTASYCPQGLLYIFGPTPEGPQVPNQDTSCRTFGTRNQRSHCSSSSFQSWSFSLSASLSSTGFKAQA